MTKLRILASLVVADDIVVVVVVVVVTGDHEDVEK